MMGGHISQGGISGYACGLKLNNSGTFTNIATDFDDFTGAKAVAITIIKNGGITTHRFLGTRMEGNANNIYIKGSESGSHKFIGCVIGTATNNSVQDDAYYKSAFLACAGYKTDHKATSNIAVGATSVVITHYLSTTPNVINIMPTSNYTSGTKGNFWWVDTITSTQFTVHLMYSPTAIFYFTWEAKYMENLVG
jgi:hypothetical protein